MREGFITCSTRNVAPGRRLAFWNQQIAGSLPHLEVRPVADNPFDANILATEFAGMKFIEIACTPTQVWHTPSTTRSAQDAGFLIHLQRRGTGLHRARGVETCLSPGDFLLCDDVLPYQQVHAAQHDVLVIRVPQAALRRRLPTPEIFLNRRICGSEGTGALVSRFINNFWELSQTGIEPSSAERITDSICDLLATAYIDADRRPLQGSTVQSMWRVRICRYIDQHLSEPELTPARIAAHFRVSPRYLHKLFSGQEEAVCKYILHRRLEGARRSLQDRAQNPKTVSTIAFEWGFSNATHFARVFRDYFGTSPTEVRGQQAPRLVNG
ncbi:MAG: helix-turn-helix domain-containing protein [Steroidobacteraceae bacterium]